MVIRGPLRLVDRHLARVHRTARHAGQRRRCREVAQDTFLRAFATLTVAIRPGRFSTWLYQVAFNLCQDRLRGRRDYLPVEIFMYFVRLRILEVKNQTRYC